MPGVVTREDIPQAHKIALTDIPKGGEVVRYGVVLGYAKAPIPVGAWINEHMLDLPSIFSSPRTLAGAIFRFRAGFRAGCPTPCWSKTPIGHWH